MTFDRLEQEIETYKLNTPRSKQLHQDASQYLPGGNSRGTSYFDPYPHFIVRGEGHYIYDVDGNRYMDFMINATSLIIGHAHPDLVQALQNQASSGVSFSGPTEAQIRMAKLLCDRLPSVDTIRFTNSGTEGTLNAIRAARAFTRRHKIAKFEGGYHGSHEYVSVSVRPTIDELSPHGTTAIPEFPGQPPDVTESVIVLPYNDLEGSERIIRSHKDELACVIMEPVASALGYLPGDPNFLRGMRELTNELGILLIFDEVQSLRVSPGGAQELFGVIPDITALGKIIGGGMPVGAFGGRRDIMALFDPSREDGAAIRHAGTFNANPMTMVAGEITMGHLIPEVYERLSGLGEMLRAKLRAVFDELGVQAHVTGVASLFGIHFTDKKITDYRSALSGDQVMKKALFTGLLNEGVLIQSGAAGALNTLTTEVEVDVMVDATRRVLQRIHERRGQ